jgi:hypothetical protein
MGVKSPHGMYNGVGEASSGLKSLERPPRVTKGGESPG